MAEKHFVCEGAICKCKFGVMPDRLKVKSQQKHYINDAKGRTKLIANDKDIGQPFEKNTFGPCKKQPTPGGYKPCQTIVTKWKGFYEKVTLINKGKPLLEDSTATCPIGGVDCIEITFHGQTAEVSQQNADNADDDVMAHLYLLGDLKEMNDYTMIPKNV